MKVFKLRLVAHTFNPSILETKTGGSLRVWGNPGVQRESQNSHWCYTERACVKKPIKKSWETSRALVAHTFNPSIQEAKAGGSLWVPGQPGIQGKCQDRLQSYTEKPCLEKPKKELGTVLTFYGYARISPTHIAISPAPKNAILETANLLPGFVPWFSWQCFCVELWSLFWNSLCRPDRPWTHLDPYPSLIQVPGLVVCYTTTQPTPNILKCWCFAMQSSKIQFKFYSKTILFNEKWWVVKS